MEAIISALQYTLSPDQTLLNDALNYFEAASKSDFCWTVAALAEIVTDGAGFQMYHSHVGVLKESLRHQATIQLKNLIKSQANAWTNLEGSLRRAMKIGLLNMLVQSINDIPKGLPQLIQVIFKTELEINDWAELPTCLVNASIQSVDSKVISRCLETIGFICECGDSLASMDVDLLLTAVVHSLQHGKDKEIISSAISALHNSLNLATANFARISERNRIMQVICESTQHSEIEVQIIGLQSLCEVMSLYYPLMEDYMEVAIWPISLGAVNSGQDGLVLAGIDIWSTICESELSMRSESGTIDEEDGDGMDEENHSEENLLILPMMPHIVPSLLKVLASKLEERDDWSPGLSAATCLALLVQLLPNRTLNLVLPFIQEQLSSGNCDLKSAGLAAAGAMLSVRNYPSIMPLVNPLIHILDPCFDEASTKVKVHAAMCAGQLARHCLLLIDDKLTYFVQVLMKGLRFGSDPLVGEYCAGALIDLLNHVDEKDKHGSGSDAAKQCLTPIYEPAVRQLLGLAFECRSSAQSTLCRLSWRVMRDMAICCPNDQLSLIDRILPEILSRLNSCPDFITLNEYQMMACSTLNAIVATMEAQELWNRSPFLLGQMLPLISSSKSEAVEEALAVLATLDQRLGPQLCASHAADVASAVLACIHVNLADIHVVSAALGLLGDTYRSSSDCEQRPFSGLNSINSEVIECLSTLQNVHADSLEVQCQCLGSLSDIAVCLEDELLPYLTPIMERLGRTCDQCLDYDMRLRSCAAAVVPGSTDDAADSARHRSDLDELWKSLFDLYSTLVQVVGRDCDSFVASFENSHSPLLVKAFQHHGKHWCGEEDDLLLSACGLVGDVFNCLRDTVDLTPLTEAVEAVLSMGTGSKATRVRTVADWARQQIKPVSSAFIVKKARVDDFMPSEVEAIEADNTVSYCVRVTLSTKQYITQNIEESVTVCLKPRNNLIQPSEAVVEDTEATIIVPPPGAAKSIDIQPRMDGGCSPEVEAGQDTIEDIRRRLKRRRRPGFANVNSGNNDDLHWKRSRDLSPDF